jgi:hypothetical protein
MNESEEQLLSLAARGQKIVIYSILLNFVVGAMDRSHAVPAWLVQALFLGTAVLALRGVIRICSGLSKSQNYKLLMMVLTFFPLVNLVSLVYLNVRVSRSLRAAGYEVGLLGVKS